MKRQVMIDRQNYDPDTAYKIAKKVFKRSFSRNPAAVCIQDDLIQEAAVRMFELGRKPQTNPKYNKHYQNHWIAHNAMVSYLKTWVRQMRYAYEGLLEVELNPIRNERQCYLPGYGWSYY